MEGEGGVPQPVQLEVEGITEAAGGMKWGRMRCVAEEYRDHHSAWLNSSSLTSSHGWSTISRAWARARWSMLSMGSKNLQPSTASASDQLYFSISHFVFPVVGLGAGRMFLQERGGYILFSRSRVLDG